MVFYLVCIILVSHSILPDFYLDNKTRIKIFSSQIQVEWYILRIDIHNSKKQYFVLNFIINL